MNKQKLHNLFDDMIKEVEKRVNLHAFIIFGSRARGNYLHYSDYDIVIIADFKQKYLGRTEWIVQTAPLVPIDVFCYTPEEFHAMFNRYHLTAIDSVDEGIVLKGEDFMKKYQEKLQEFKRKGMKKRNNVLYPPS